VEETGEGEEGEHLAAVRLKGQCHEIFCFWFFHESVSPQPRSIPLGLFRIFRKFVEIFARQGAPPVSTTPAANFATNFPSVVDTGGKFATGGKQWDLLSDCSQLKMNLKKKIYPYANSTTQRCSKVIIKIFLIEDFFHLPPVLTTQVVNLELRISPRIFEKNRNGPNRILWGWGETDP
jgi:hypothetical protein